MMFEGHTRAVLRSRGERNAAIEIHTQNPFSELEPGRSRGFQVPVFLNRSCKLSITRIYAIPGFETLPRPAAWTYRR